MCFENLLPKNDELWKGGTRIYNHKYLLRINIPNTKLGTQLNKTGNVLVLMTHEMKMMGTRK